MSKPNIEWVEIPAGKFLMGSPDSEIDRYEEEILHEVSLSAFKMSKYAITFDQFDAFCIAKNLKKPFDSGWGRGKMPVINVSWFEANQFAEWMGCRLPSEAEWEYACRAGTTTPFNTGDDLSTANSNYDGNNPYNNNPRGTYLKKSLPVGSFAPNAFGLYDTHGNVWEWCNDWYGDYSKSPQSNPKGPDSGSYRVSRGGGWLSGADHCRSAYRDGGTPDNRFNFLGFRLASNN